MKQGFVVSYVAPATTLCWLALSALPARGQSTPFFGGGVVAYDPVPATIYSGAVMDAQAVVSEDRRYVTLNMRTTNSRLRQLVQFPVANTNVVQQGFVGGVVFPTDNNPGGAGARAIGTGGAARANSTPTTPASPLKGPSPDAIDRAGKSWVLARQGMYLVSPLR